MRCLFLLASIVAFGSEIFAQPADSIHSLTTRYPELLHGTSVRYYTLDTTDTSAPEGYLPFFINHLGRHGSRTHVSEKTVAGLRNALSKADSLGLLTDEGQRLKEQVDAIFGRMDYRWGDLTADGLQQHRDIARRMYRRFPPVFDTAGVNRIEATSTVVPRSMVSMAGFVEGLKTSDPQLVVSMNSSHAYDNTLWSFTNREYGRQLGSSSWRPMRDEYLNRIVDSSRFTTELFTDDPSAVIPSVRQFMSDLWSLASIMPNTDYGIELDGYFTPEESFSLWQVSNLGQYLRKGNSVPAAGLSLAMAKPLLQEMLDASNLAVQQPERLSARLRFAHGENVIPIAELLGIEGFEVCEAVADSVYKVWQDFNINPMAANIQWVFYRNPAGEVLVKVLFNEREVRLPLEDQRLAPYYRWQDFLDRYSAVAEGLPTLSPINGQR